MGLIGRSTYPNPFIWMLEHGTSGWEWSGIIALIDASGSTDDLINTLLDLKPGPSLWLRNLHPDEVYITPVLLEYRLQHLSSTVAYRPLATLRRFKQQCGALLLIECDALPLLQFPLSLWETAYDWYHALFGIVIPTWRVMEERFLREQSTYQHNSKF